MALLIGAVDWLLLHYSHGAGELAVVWLGNGFLAAWMLSRPTHLWRWYVFAGLLADIGARMLDDTSMLRAVGRGLADMIEVLIVAGAIRRRVPDIGDPQRWLTLGGIAISSTLLGCAISAVLASLANMLAGGRFLDDLLSWYAAHVVGMVVFGTAALVMHRRGVRLLAAKGRRKSFAIDMLLITGICVLVFSVRLPVLFLAYPPLLLAAFRHGFSGVAMGMLLFGLIGSVATMMDKGPITLLDSSAGHIALLQIYIAGACLMTIPVALVMAERYRLNARVRDSEMRFRMLADYSHDVIVRMRADGERLYVSPSAYDILGWAPAEMLGLRWNLVHPDDRDLQQEVMREVLESGLPRTATYRVQHKDGHYVWIEAVARPIPSIDRQGMDIIFTGRDISRRVAAEAALEASRRELERLARVDSLTGLANRRQFEERLQLSLARSQRQGVPLALMYLDVDHFKQINDTWGHAAGDRVLCSFAERLTNCVRATDLVARLGGDEFVVIVEDASLPDAAETVARKLIDEMHHGIKVDEVTLVATTSIGIAFTAAPVDAATLLASADAALYAAKQAGRNTWRIRAAATTLGRGSANA